jgi:uncharacterized protein
MKRLLLAAAVACCTIASLSPVAVDAAPPTEAQVDRLLETMDMRRTLDEMFAQMETLSDSMTLQMLGEDATAEQRDGAKRAAAGQLQAMRKTMSWETMSWETMAPVYRRVYARLFTAEEVDAMIAFYGSEAGRGIMRKMPQAMQLTMEEMQPMMAQMIAEMQKTLETELHKGREKEQSHSHD